jgi:hypothetical protein
MAHAPGAQMQNVNFLETGVTGLVYFIEVQYSAINKGLPNNNQLEP